MADLVGGGFSGYDCHPIGKLEETPDWAGVKIPDCANFLRSWGAHGLV